MKLESLDLNLLLVFDALATERSVTQAAAKVGLSQPALSNALARLRALFRDPLFERSAGQMQPTPRARQLLVPFSEAISKLREALEPQAAFRPDASDREFLIATNDYVDSLLLPRIAQRLQRDAPSIALRTVRTDYLFLPPGRAFAIGRTRFGPRLFRRNAAAESRTAKQAFVNRATGLHFEHDPSACRPQTQPAHLR